MMDRIYIEGEVNHVRVGMRQIRLSDSIVVKDDGSQVRRKNGAVIVYDTSGPYGDISYTSDYKVGLPRMREPWFTRRKDLRRKDADAVERPVYVSKKGKSVTQMYYAKKRMITPEMEYVAIRENQQIEAMGLKSYITPDFVRKELAAGRAVIPAGINHFELEPMAIGSRFKVKINGNMECGYEFGKDTAEMVKCFCRCGADVLRLFSCETDFYVKKIVANAPIPVAVSPLDQALAKVGGIVENLSWDVFQETVVALLESGVDVISVPAAMKLMHLQMMSNRLVGTASQAGRVLAEWMKIHQEENFLNVHFTDICEIAKQYDAVVSISAALSSGSIYDANDQLQFAEMNEMRNLIEEAWGQYVQVMVESASHIPMNKIGQYMKEYHYLCKDVPFSSPEVMVSDLSLDCGHVAGVIGGAQMAWCGASLIGSGKKHVLIADEGQIRMELLGYKMAAHAADVAKGHPGAQVRDNALIKARLENRKKDYRNLSIVS